MKRANLETGLDLVEKILTEKIKTHKENGQMTAMVSSENALKMVRWAREGNIEMLKLLLEK